MGIIYTGSDTIKTITSPTNLITDWADAKGFTSARAKYIQMLLEEDSSDATITITELGMTGDPFLIQSGETYEISSDSIEDFIVNGNDVKFKWNGKLEEDTLISQDPDTISIKWIHPAMRSDYKVGYTYILGEVRQNPKYLDDYAIYFDPIIGTWDDYTI